MFLQNSIGEGRPLKRPFCRHARADAEPQSGSGLALVTGGAGFIGSNLVTRLLDLGFHVRILDDLSTGDAGYVDTTDSRVELHVGDIRNIEDCTTAMQGVAYVYHLAAMSKVKPSLTDPAIGTFCADVNVIGTANVLQAAKAAGVQKLVYAASSTYYGNALPPHTESMLWMPSSPYAATKYAAELLTTTYNHVYGLPTLNLRFFMVYGPRQPSTGAYAIVTGVFTQQQLEGSMLTVEGDGSHYRDFVHVYDIVRGLIVGMQSNVSGESINLGTGETMSVKELADMVSPNQSQVAERPFDLVGTLADTCKAKKVLNWQATYSMREEMPKLLQAANVELPLTESGGGSIQSRNTAARDRFDKLRNKRLSIFG